MPQITLEHTTNLQPERPWSDLLSQLHDQIAGLAGIEVSACKSRVLALDTYHVGDGAKNQAFAHLTIRIFAGRSPAVKTELGRAGLALLKQTLGTTDDALDIQLTVELQDIDREAYFKQRLTPTST